MGEGVKMPPGGSAAGHLSALMSSLTHGVPPPVARLSLTSGYGGDTSVRVPRLGTSPTVHVHRGHTVEGSSTVAHAAALLDRRGRAEWPCRTVSRRGVSMGQRGSCPSPEGRVPTFGLRHKRASSRLRVGAKAHVRLSLRCTSPEAQVPRSTDRSPVSVPPGSVHLSSSISSSTQGVPSPGARPSFPNGYRGDTSVRTPANGVGSSGQ